MDVEQVRAIIAGLPEVEEYDHGGLPAFRVRGRRFASMLDHDGVNLMPGEEAIRSAVAAWPRWCREEWWGKKLAAVRLQIASADPEVAEELITEAWASKAPKTLTEPSGGEEETAWPVP